MKLVLMFTFGFVLIDCQRFYYPAPLNPLLHHRATPFAVPLPWYHLAAPQGSAGETLEQHVAESSDDSEARFRPNSPLEHNASPRFLFNNGINNNYLFGVNSNFAFKTLVYTVISTTTVITTSLCLPSSNVIAGATTCVRRRRDLEAFLLGLDKYYNRFDGQADSLQPSPTLTVETTVVPTFDPDRMDSPLASSPAISSSKYDGGELADGVQRVRRFFTAARLTFTSWLFVTTTVQQPANARFLFNYQLCPIGNTQPEFVLPNFPPFSCAFGCIPPGYSICTAQA